MKEPDEILESILLSTKKLLGLDPEYIPFDVDIIMAINTALFTLWQLGVGPKDKPMMVSDEESKWSELVDEGMIEMCKSYVYLRVRMLFDPPTSGFLVDSINGQIKEYEWRLTVGMDEYNNYYKELEGG